MAWRWAEFVLICVAVGLAMWLCFVWLPDIMERMLIAMGGGHNA
jgi:hypothetical protein